MVFIMTILQRNTRVKGNKDISRLLMKRMDMWDDGGFDSLVEECVRLMSARVSSMRGELNDKEIFRRFDQMVKHGEIRSAARFVTERLAGGVLLPDQIDEKSGKPVLEALRLKHPEPHDPDYARLRAQFPDSPPPIPHVSITEKMIREGAVKLSGAGGVSGADNGVVKDWLLGHRGSSSILRTALARFAEWMANAMVPWAGIRGFQTSRLIALAKIPIGIRPIGIGDILTRLAAKTVLSATRSEAAEACGIDQTCAGLAAGIEGDVHSIRLLFDQWQEDEDWGFFMTDARNAFNSACRKTLL